MGGVLGLLGQAVGGKFLELIGPMDGEAIARSAEQAAQHRHRSRVGREMGVNMGDTELVAPLAQADRLREIGGMTDQAAPRGPFQFTHRLQRLAEAARSEQRLAGEPSDQPAAFPGQQIFDAPALAHVLRIDQSLGPLPHRKPLDRHTSPFDRADLTADEGGARHRIAVEQIGQLHACLACSTSRTTASIRSWLITGLSTAPARTSAVKCSISWL